MILKYNDETYNLNFTLNTYSLLDVNKITKKNMTNNY